MRLNGDFGEFHNCLPSEGVDCAICRLEVVLRSSEKIRGGQNLNIQRNPPVLRQSKNLRRQTNYAKSRGSYASQFLTLPVPKANEDLWLNFTSLLSIHNTTAFGLAGAGQFIMQPS